MNVISNQALDTITKFNKLICVHLYNINSDFHIREFIWSPKLNYTSDPPSYLCKFFWKKVDCTVYQLYLHLYYLWAMATSLLYLSHGLKHFSDAFEIMFIWLFRRDINSILIMKDRFYLEKLYCRNPSLANQDVEVMILKGLTQWSNGSHLLSHD